MPRHHSPMSEHRSSILKREMSWTLHRNARDIDNQCLDIVDQWTVFSFHLDICQQYPDIDHRYLLFSVCKHSRHLKFTHQRPETQQCAPTSPLIWIPCAPMLPQVYRSLINCFLCKMLIFSYKYSILIVSLNINDYKIVCINLIYLKFILFNDLIHWLQS